MQVKVIIDHKSLEYFITTKKPTRCQACWAKFLSGFNFVISYTSGKKNQKTYSLTYHLNNLLLNNNIDWQQYLLQTFLLTKRLEIVSIEEKKNIIIIEKVV